MTHFSSSDQATCLREHLGTKVYMASHAALRPYMRRARRPVEFGDRIWPAALYAMSRILVGASDRVLEIGCGWGIVGIHLARVYGAQVTCTDSDPRLLPFVQLHAALNGVSVAFEERSFAGMARAPIAADVIVGSDICYSDDVVRDLTRLVDASAQRGVRRIVIADGGRPDFASLVEHCKGRYDCELSTDEGDGTPKRVSLLEISLRGVQERGHPDTRARARTSAGRREAGYMTKKQSQGAEAPSELIDRKIAELDDWRGEMLARIRAVIKEADPDVVEEWKWRGTPVWSHGGIICTGETYKQVVKMTFAKGASLKDPAGLFNASLDGNVRRAIDVHEGDTLNAKALKALIRAAVALNLSSARR